ncbi:hypothetical protein SDC9_142770 [bioreactor metagenome]|uniref:Uncharacterized protein n=1 Tax=bioreactor metagenome TaxID=1076179 RepID=A0A645E261_9ZZZZ
MKFLKITSLTIAMLTLLSIVVTTTSTVHAAENVISIDNSVSDNPNTIMGLKLDIIEQNNLIEFDDSEDIDIQNLSQNQKNFILQVATKSTEQIDGIETVEQQAVAAEYILGVFDSNSDYYQNPLKAQSEMQNRLKEEFGIQILPNLNSMLKSHGLLSVGVLGAIINTGLSVITGGSISAYVKKKGWNALVNALQSRLMTTLKFKQLGKIIGGLSGTIMKILDPGTFIAEQIDNSRFDKIRGNGWIELW